MPQSIDNKVISRIYPMKKPKKYYLVGRIDSEATTNHGNIDLAWFPDQKGAMPVFTSKTAAKAAAGQGKGKPAFPIYEMNAESEATNESV